MVSLHILRRLYIIYIFIILLLKRYVKEYMGVRMSYALRGYNVFTYEFNNVFI